MDNWIEHDIVLWCSKDDYRISGIKMGSGEEMVRLDGAMVENGMKSRPIIKKIPGSSLIVSVNSGGPGRSSLK